MRFLQKKNKDLTKTCENFKVNNLATFLPNNLGKKVAKLLTLTFWPKTKTQLVKIIKKPIFKVFWEQQGKNNKTDQKKTIICAHATITCLLKNPRKSFHPFGVLFFFCFGFA